MANGFDAIKYLEGMVGGGTQADIIARTTTAGVRPPPPGEGAPAPQESEYYYIGELPNGNQVWGFITPEGKEERYELDSLTKALKKIGSYTLPEGKLPYRPQYQEYDEGESFWMNRPDGGLMEVTQERNPKTGRTEIVPTGRTQRVPRATTSERIVEGGKTYEVTTDQFGNEISRVEVKPWDTGEPAPEDAPTDPYGRMPTWNGKGWDYPPDWNEVPKDIAEARRIKEASDARMWAAQQATEQRYWGTQQAAQAKEAALISAGPASWLDLAIHRGQPPTEQPFMGELGGYSYTRGQPIPGFEMVGGQPEGRGVYPAGKSILDLAQWGAAGGPTKTAPRPFMKMEVSPGKMPSFPIPTRQQQLGWGPDPMALWGAYQQVKTGKTPAQSAHELSLWGPGTGGRRRVSYA